MTKQEWRNALVRVWAYRQNIGFEDVVLFAGMALITVALWPLAERWFGAGQVAFLPAGGILVYMALPQRLGFFHRVTLQGPPQAPKGRG